MKFNVIMSSPTWTLSGVNIGAVNLIRSLRNHEIPAYFLLTNPNQFDPIPMSIPSDIPVEILPVNHNASWKNRWETMIQYLEERAPCIYIPGYDWDHSCVARGP